MIMAIVRVAVINLTRQSTETAWLYFWSNLEVGVGKFHSSPTQLEFKWTHPCLSYYHFLRRFVPSALRSQAWTDQE
jgi:hypothetical protein